MNVPDGGSVQFRIDARKENENSSKNGQAGVYFVHRQYSYDGLAGSPGNENDTKWFDGKGDLANGKHGYYTYRDYSLNNITQDTIIDAELWTYWYDPNRPNNAKTDEFIKNITVTSNGATHPIDPIIETVESIVPVGDPVDISADNNWSHTWDNLPQKDEKGNPYTYYVRELPVANYDASYPNDAESETTGDGKTVYKVENNESITITNTHRMKDAEIPVEKRWGADVTNQADKVVYIVLCDEDGNPILKMDRRHCWN